MSYLIAGIILLVVGLLLKYLTPAPFSTIGLVIAIIGVVLLVIGIVFLIAGPLVILPLIM